LPEGYRAFSDIVEQTRAKVKIFHARERPFVRGTRRSNNHFGPADNSETSDGQPKILVEVAIGDLETIDAFMADLLHQVLIERMISPPETAEMRVTFIGNLTAAQFAERWSRQLVHDPALQFFMSKMTTAEVVHSTESGRTLDRASLLVGGRREPAMRGRE
jgi:hypothetical protein